MAEKQFFRLMALPDVVLFPRMTLPLYIFEQRYRGLLEDCLEGDRMFAVVRSIENRIAPVFGAGLLTTVVRNQDGTYHILVEGMKRYRIASVEERDPLLRVKAVPVSESIIESIPAGRRENILNRLRKFDNGNGRVLDFVGQLEALKIHLNGFTDIIAGSFISDPDVRQKLLSEADPKKRLTMIEDFLENV